MAKTTTKRVRRIQRKNIERGAAHIHSTFNNTIVTLTDEAGNVISWASAGELGFKGSRKSTPFAAQMAAETASKAAMEHGLKKVDVGVTQAVTAILDGTVEWGTQKVLGYADGAVGLAENDYYKANMTADELAKVKEFTDKVLNGETKVVDELTQPGVFDQYYNQYGLK